MFRLKRGREAKDDRQLESDVLKTMRAAVSREALDLEDLDADDGAARIRVVCDFAVANHRNVRSRVNAGRTICSTFHHKGHNGIGFSDPELPCNCR